MFWYNIITPYFEMYATKFVYQFYDHELSSDL